MVLEGRLNNIVISLTIIEKIVQKRELYFKFGNDLN
jgi:hypothetical protein